MATSKQKRERLARAEQARREQEQAAKRKRTIRSVGIGAIAVVLIGVVVFVVVRMNQDAPVVVPDNVTAEGGVRYPAAQSPAGDAVSVVVYEDPLCPHCRDFEEEHGDYLQNAADNGAITLEYRPIALLGDDSVPPINAAACVLDAAGRQSFVKFHDAIFSGEYAESSLTDLAADAGATQDSVATCIDDGTHDGWVEQVTDDASDNGVDRTPTVRVDGDTVDDLDEIESLIEEARR